MEAAQDRIAINIDTKLERVLAAVSAQPGGPTSAVDPIEAHLDREIDGYRELGSSGSPTKAMALFEQLLSKVEATASGRIIFRIKANIGSCLIKLARIDEGADKLLEAFDHAPEEPRAISNKALGLLLKKEWQAVLDMGKHHLARGIADEHFSNVVIQAAKFDDAINDPLSLVPEAHRETAAVTVAVVDFVRSRETGQVWWRTAASAIERFPDEPYLRQFFADATLEEASFSEEFVTTGRLGESLRKRVVEATGVLRTIWEMDLSSDAAPDEEAIGVLSNLIVGLRLLAEMPEAILRVKQGIAAGAVSSWFYVRAAAVAMETRSPDLDVDELLSKVETSPEKHMMIAQRLLARGKWKELANYTDDDIRALPSTEQSAFETAVRVAKISIGPNEAIPAELSSLLAGDKLGIRSLVVVSDFATKRGHEDIAEQAYGRALRLLSEETHFSGRYMLARTALAREMWSDAADILIGRVDTNVDNDTLQDLTTALVNERPPRQRALSFFKALHPDVRKLERYRHAEGFLHYHRGDLKLAEACIRKALPGNRVDDLLLLLKILREQDKNTEAEDLLRSVTISDLKGDPSYRMIILQELIDVGRSEEAVDAGYRLARKHRNDADVMLKYVGLMFRAFDDGQIATPSQVQADTSFRIEDEDEKSIWLTIEGKEDRVSEGIISAKHPFAENALGYTVGHSFPLQHGFGKTHEWAIKEIKSKYLHLFHEVMESFEDQFPGVRGISTVALEDGDFEPLFAQVRRAAEQSQKIVELYVEKQVPLAVVAASTNKDPISFAAQVRGQGHDIVACIGQHAERADGLRTIENHRAAGAVLDSYTAWTAAELGLFDVLKSVFGQLVIPRSVLHDLEILQGETEYTDRQSMSIGWHDGQFFKEMHTRENFEARRDYINQRIELIKGDCQVIPVDAPDKSHEAAKVVAMFGSEPFNSAALAGTGYVLVSDDHHYRKWAELMWSAKGTWLQAVLDFAAHAGDITLAQYADWVGKLAELRHGFIYLNGIAINALIGDGGATNWPRVEAAFDYIGSKNADLHSHLETVLSFVTVATRTGNAHGVHFEKALGLLLEKVVRGRPDNWPELLWFLYAQTKPRIRQYLLQWMKGHFLDPTPIFAIQRYYLQQTLEASIESVYDKVWSRATVRIPSA